MLKTYVSELLKQSWVWATGAIGVIALITDIFFQGIFPTILYPIIFGLGIIVGGYLVFKKGHEEHAKKESDLNQQILTLKNEITTLQNSQPNISVHFLKGRDEISQKFEILLPEIPEKPDFTDVIASKHEQLIQDWKKSHASNFMLQRPNPDFETDLDTYLIEYQKHLNKIYDSHIAKSVAFYVKPIIFNKGTKPAENVSVILTMPNNYLPPTESQSLITELVFENDVEGLKYELAPPSKPKFTLNAFDSITLPSSLYSTLGNRSDFLEELANISGPIIERTTNGYTITYKIKKLVQHQPEKDFEPFLLWLDNIDKPTLWEVPVKIVSASLPEPKKDTLYIQINPNV